MVWEGGSHYLGPLEKSFDGDEIIHHRNSWLQLKRGSPAASPSKNGAWKTTFPLVKGLYFYTPKTNMSLQKRTISVGNTSSNHWFSGDMLVFTGVGAVLVSGTVFTTSWLQWGNAMVESNNISRPKRNHMVASVQTSPRWSTFRNPSWTGISPLKGFMYGMYIHLHLP